jgi:hypothetical protein
MDGAVVGLTFEGGEDLVRALTAQSVEFRQEALIEALTEAAEPMRSRMASLAPKGPDAPHIAQNIVVWKLARVEGFSLAPGSAAVGVGPRKGFAYGLPLEMGFHHAPDGKPLPARPFVRPGFEQERDGALTAIGRKLWDLITGRTRSTTSGLA